MPLRDRRPPPDDRTGRGGYRGPWPGGSTTNDPRVIDLARVSLSGGHIVQVRTPDEARTAQALGAAGVLCSPGDDQRTPDRIRAILEVVGGQGPQHLVNEFAHAIARGEAQMVLLTGSESISTVRHLMTRGETRDWAEQVEGPLEDRGFGDPLLTRDLAHHGDGPVFAQIKINPEALYFVLPPADGVILTTRFRQAVLGDSALYN